MARRAAGKSDVPSYMLDASVGPERLRAGEWLLTNGMSGFAFGTALGVPARRYHGMLVSETPQSPLRRVYVNALEEELVVTDKAGKRVEPLSSFCFRAGDGSDVLHPEGWRRVRRFEKGAVCRWEFDAGGVKIVKRLALRRDARAAVADYEVTPPRGAQVELRVRPLVSLRDFHGLLRHRDGAREFEVRRAADSEHGAGCEVHRTDGSARVYFTWEGGGFEHEEQWWYNFVYCADRERGQECVEDLFSPGEFVLTSGARGGSVWGGLQFALEPGLGVVGIDEIAREETARRALLARAVQHSARAKPAGGGPGGDAAERLALAGDDFVFARENAAGERTVSVIAGYPWFGEWGRDALIALPGLLLDCARAEEALGVLGRFAGARRSGIIPNRFGDEQGEPQYNTVDASLWFIVAAWRYLRATGDRRGFEGTLLPACLDVVDHYRRGTDHGIAMDPDDFLIAAGSAGTQLTWMDALRDGVVFTPRHGKPVEINALWCNALAMLAEATARTDAVRSADLRATADAAAGSFRTRFWNDKRSCCFDVLRPAGRSWEPVDELRPNQIFAVSLPHSPLNPAQRESVVRVVRERLYTPLGVRTLEPGHPAYRGRFRGTIRELDEAYHNGTAWPWLLGPLAEAVLRVGGFSPGACAEARGLLEPIVGYLDGWCLGQLPEVFDGDGTARDPQRPGGCSAQAWSVAEVLRAWVMADRGE